MKEIGIVSIDRCLIPKEVTFLNKVYIVEDIDSNYYIKGYKLGVSEDERILNIYIDDIHPNVNPKNKQYCCPLPLEDLNIKYNELNKINNLIEKQLIGKFFFDASYFTPNHIKHFLTYSVILKRAVDFSEFDHSVLNLLQNCILVEVTNPHPDPDTVEFNKIVKRMDLSNVKPISLLSFKDRIPLDKLYSIK